MSEKTNTTAIATINNVEILLIENGEKRIAIKPICEALGVDYATQFTRIKEDCFLSSVIGLRATTGSDGKSYKMQTIPFKYVFGWLFKINPKNVKEEAKEVLIKYQIECYDALYEHFTSYANFVETKQVEIDKQLDIYETAKKNFREANSVLKEAEKELKKIRSFSFADFKKRQLNLFEFEQNQIDA